MKITWAATMRADQGVRLPDAVWVRCKQSGLRRLLVGVESGSNEVLKRIKKDIKIEQVYADRAKDAEVRHCRPFPVHRRISGRDRCAYSSHPGLRKKTALDEPGFFDTDLLLQALSRAARLVIEAVARGFRLPQTLEEWANVRLRRRRTGTLGVCGQIRTHRALQIFPRTRLEKGVARQTALATARALSLR